MKKECRYCKKSFDTSRGSKVFCNYICSENERLQIRTNNWVKRKGKKLPVSLTSPNANSAHVYHKEPSYLKKFKSVRG